jgi:hypothetical protein
MGDVVTGGVSPFERVRIPNTRSSAAFLDETEVLHRRVRDLHADTAGLRRAGLVRDLDERQQSAAARGGPDLLRALGDAGMAWRDVARLVKVSVPAVQKWRRGEGITGANRLRLAKVVAMLEVLGEHFVNEQVSWLEMPVKEGVAISRLDMLAVDRYDLVLELLSDDDGVAPVEDVLDEFDPEWKQTRVDNAFETYVAADGVVSIRPIA